MLCAVAREAGVEGESWRALVMGTAETEVARSWGAGAGISEHCGHGAGAAAGHHTAGPLNRSEGYIMALIRSGYHCAES